MSKRLISATLATLLLATPVQAQDEDAPDCSGAAALVCAALVIPVALWALGQAYEAACPDLIAPEDWGAPDGRQYLCGAADGALRPTSRLMGCQTQESPERPYYADCGDSREPGPSMAAAPEPVDPPEPPEPQEPSEPTETPQGE